MLLLRSAAIIVVLTALAPTALALEPPNFTPLGQYPGGMWSTPQDLTPDGAVVVGGARDAAGNYEAFKWTPADGLVPLGTLDCGSSMTLSMATCITPDGQRIFGTSRYDSAWLGDLEAVEFNSDGTITQYGFVDHPGILDATQIGAVTADGSMFVGVAGDAASHAVAYYWTVADGMVSLGDLPGGYEVGRAQAVSNDGRVIAGSGAVDYYYHRQAFKWTAADGLMSLAPLPGYVESEAFALSADGSIVVGYCEDGSQAESCCWIGDSDPVSLGDPAPYWIAVRAAVADADAGIIAGSADISLSDYEAFIWSRRAGLHSLNEVVATNLGLDLGGWVLQEVNGVSPDGRFLIGVGLNPQGEREGWRLDVGDPPRCLGDFDGDGYRNLADLAELLSSYNHDDVGDLDGDGDTDLTDLAIILSLYGQPCVW